MPRAISGALSRAALLAGLIVLPATAPACINDSAVGGREAEFRSTYGVEEPPAPARSLGAWVAGTLVIGTAVAALGIAGAAVLLRVRERPLG